ncbi:hypothetical protein ABTN29_20430 [Acinetobacter baumannii]
MAKILEGKVKIGMTKEMCLLAWGEPKKINETITAGKNQNNGFMTTIIFI